MNGDLVTQADLGEVFEFHNAGEQVGTIGVRPYPISIPFGCVELRGDTVTRIVEKPTETRLVNAGIYVLNPQFLAHVPKATNIGLPSLLESAIERGDEVRAFEIHDEWTDIGNHGDLSKARRG